MYVLCSDRCKAAEVVLWGIFICSMFSFPQIEAVLHHCCQERWSDTNLDTILHHRYMYKSCMVYITYLREFPVHNGSSTAAPVRPLSPHFLQTVTEQYYSSKRIIFCFSRFYGLFVCIDSPLNMTLSYKSQVVLWTAYPPALRHEVYVYK